MPLIATLRVLYYISDVKSVPRYVHFFNNSSKFWSFDNTISSMRIIFIEFCHPVQSTVVHTTCVLLILPNIVAIFESDDKFKVTTTSIPYFIALVYVVEEISSQTNLLLDHDVLTNSLIEALLLTVLATFVRNTSDENEMRIIYEYLSESNIVIPKVFPVKHNL
ncbi:unnamed protein product [Rotaria sp. Silwood2]|nr:unnamed protein product [Rotaria sp. Silwood2]CAF4454036.1 unnamed protein product [Rotaria sp. Silwood2]